MGMMAMAQSYWIAIGQGSPSESGWAERRPSGHLRSALRAA